MNTSLNRSTELRDDTLLEELSNVIGRIEDRIETARFKHRAALEAAQQKPAESATPVRGAIGRFLSRRQERTPLPSKGPLFAGSSTPQDDQQQQPAAAPAAAARSKPMDKGNAADFIDFPEQTEFIEDLRRVAELCIIGENHVTSIEKKAAQKEQRAKERWVAARDNMEEDILNEAGQGDEEDGFDMEGKLQLFDMFFERNTLAVIVDMLNGESFRFPKGLMSKNIIEEEDEEGEEDNENDESDSEADVLLPPLAIATQALQSISILIQNVSRATSLYVILSNNYVNKLINMPLDLYMTAEKRRLIASKESKSLPSVFTSPQVTEVATHFVTFLKSLAMRMNAETLQFFLKYHTEGIEGGTSTASSSHFSNNNGSNSVASGNESTVEFPLYERALHFCASHHDSFVRTTAMNICLNTLRLTTITDDEKETPAVAGANSTASPDGVLHNSIALPFRERLTIAQFACIPSRVEHLVSPIFTKLAERWSALDEQIRAIDSNRHMGVVEAKDTDGVRNERVAEAKEKVRRTRLFRNFKEKVADLHDELLLLDDVFQVGLTVLNEQMIEMMMATLVYPLLLQPLLLYCQRLNAAVDEERFSFSDHPFGGIGADLSDVGITLLPVSSPAKAALLTLASVFKFVSNRPLLRLMYTVLFHPLSPDSTSAPTVRSKLEVATEDSKGQRCIRLDPRYPIGEEIPDERTTYAFGTSLTDRRRSRSDLQDLESESEKEACIFVLAPALAEVLEYRGRDVALIARTRPNPYRAALVRCLTVPGDMSDVRELAVCVFGTAFSGFHGSFIASILFGTDLKTFADDMPADERNLDSQYAHLQDDRGIGGSVGIDLHSRMSFGGNSGKVGANLTTEVVQALCSCIIYAARVASDEWKLGYDHVAAHTLLLAVQCHPGAMLAASKNLKNRWRQAAVVLAQVPSSGLNPMGGSSIILPGAPSINDPNYEARMFESFLNLVFYDTVEQSGEGVTTEFLQLEESFGDQGRAGYAISIASECSLDALCKRVGDLLLQGRSGSGIRSLDIETIEERRESASCFFKLDALLVLLKDLAATAGLSIRDMALKGIAFAPNGSIVQLDEAFDARSVYANVSEEISDFFFWTDTDTEDLQWRSTINLVGRPAIPCVCEAVEPLSHYFVDDATGLVAEGVSWQSLFIVFVRNYIVFVQPITNSTGETGRVIAAASLERASAEADMSLPEDGAPARRLVLTNTWFHDVLPALYLFDAVPEYEKHGPFLRVKPFASRLDLWFENERAVEYAHDVILHHIFKAKADRGHRIQRFLDPKPDNAYG